MQDLQFNSNNISKTDQKKQKHVVKEKGITGRPVIGQRVVLQSLSRALKNAAFSNERIYVGEKADRLK